MSNDQDTLRDEYSENLIRSGERGKYTKACGTKEEVVTLMNPPDQFLTLHEIVAAARRNLAPGPWNYLIGATDTETTMRRNRQAPDSIAFRPRVLNDVSTVDTSARFLGKKVRLPVMLAPVGGMESFTAGAAADAGSHGVRRMEAACSSRRRCRGTP